MMCFSSDLAQRNWELQDDLKVDVADGNQVNSNFCWNKPLYDHIENAHLSDNYRLSVINVILFLISREEFTQDGFKFQKRKIKIALVGTALNW